MKSNKRAGHLPYSQAIAMACALLALASCSADSTAGTGTSTSAAGSNATIEHITQELQAELSLYDQCEPGGANLQGNCPSGMVCQTIISGGFRCYLSTAAGCPSEMTSYMGVACLETCDPITPGGFCTSPLTCDYGWCVP